MPTCILFKKWCWYFSFACSALLWILNDNTLQQNHHINEHFMWTSVIKWGQNGVTNYSFFCKMLYRYIKLPSYHFATMLIIILIMRFSEVSRLAMKFLYKMNKTIFRNKLILLSSSFSIYAFFERMRKDKNYYNTGVQKSIAFHNFLVTISIYWKGK